MLTLLLIHVFIIMLKINLLAFCCLNCAGIVCRQESWRARDRGKVCKCNTMLASCLRGYRRRLLNLLLFLAIFLFIASFHYLCLFLQLVIYIYILYLFIFLIYIYRFFFFFIYIFHFFFFFLYIYMHTEK